MGMFLCENEKKVATKRWPKTGRKNVETDWLDRFIRLIRLYPLKSQIL